MTCWTRFYPRTAMTLSVLALLLGLAEGMRGQTITEFPLPNGGTDPSGIATGPDGNLWFTETFGNQIGRITTGGVITEFPIATASSFPTGITAGPDGNLWFTEALGNQIGRITTGGVVTEFPLPTAFSVPVGITAGPDGNLWFTEQFGNQIGRITAAGVITEFPIPTANSFPTDITAGPDGNLWFTEQAVGQIGRITTAGVITELPVPTGGGPSGITAGPDGALWFTGSGNNEIGRVTTAGAFTEFPADMSAIADITAGSDGNLWFTSYLFGIGRITPAGVVTQFVSPSIFDSLPGIAPGPDGALWYTASKTEDTDFPTSWIGRITTGGTVPSTAPTGLAVDSAGNGVLEPNELLPVAVEPTWRNDSGVSISLTGTSSNFTGPAGPAYDNPDATADYATIGIGASAQCTDCYSVQITAATRPVQHWDTTIEETVVAAPGGASPAKTWTLHVGDSFVDVPSTDPYYPSIETIFHLGVTAGCGAATYCPSQNSLRQEMAPFLLKSRFGAGYAPPVCTGIFSDVPCPPTPAFPYSNFIEDLSNRGIAAGCAPGFYCPDQDVSRAQMAPLLLKTLEGSSYVPPACAGIFTDVPCPATVDFPFSDWIEDLSNLGITAGCAPSLYCPDAPITRQEIAVFLKLTFGLVLYGP